MSTEISIHRTAMEKIAKLLSQRPGFHHKEQLNSRSSGMTLYFNNLASVTITTAYFGEKDKSEDPGIRIYFPQHKSLALVLNADSNWVCTNGQAVGTPSEIAQLIHSVVHDQSILNRYPCTANDAKYI